MVWNTGRILDCKAFEWYFDDNLHTLGTLANPCSIVFISISIDPSVMMTGSFLFHIVKMVKIHLKNFFYVCPLFTLTHGVFVSFPGSVSTFHPDTWGLWVFYGVCVHFLLGHMGSLGLLWGLCPLFTRTHRHIVT